MAHEKLCQADCFRDGFWYRPIDDPKKLVWQYFEITNSNGELEPRQFIVCPCGCGRYKSVPHHSLHYSIKMNDTYKLVAVKRAWVPELLFAMFKWVIPYQPFRWVFTKSV